MQSHEISKLASLEDSHWWYAARRALLARSLEGTVPGRALDTGAGAGGNTRVLQNAGWSATALEYSRTGAEIARQRGLSVVQADATALPFPNEAFDLVVSMDLWEHIPDDATAAAEASRVLRPGGRLFLAVPADMRLWSGHDVAVGHVRRYERVGLTELVEGAGFTIHSARPWNVLLRPLVRLRRGGRNSQELSSDLERVPRALNASLRAIVEAERWLPLGHAPGVTLIVEASKPAA